MQKGSSRGLYFAKVFTAGSLFTAVMFYKVAKNTELVDTETFTPRRNKELCSCEPRVTRFLLINQYQNLVLGVCLLKNT